MRENGIFLTRRLRGVYARNFVYQDVRGWESFEPWLSRVERLISAVIHEIAGAVPPEWTGNDWDEMGSWRRQSWNAEAKCGS